MCPAGQVHQQQQAELQQEPGQLTVQLPHETQEHTKAKEARRPAPVPSWHDEQESLSVNKGITYSHDRALPAEMRRTVKLVLWADSDWQGDIKVSKDPRSRSRGGHLT